MTDTTTAHSEPSQPLGLPLNDLLGPLPEKSYLGDDASYGYDAEDVRVYALEAAKRVLAAERERCAKLCYTHRRSFPMDGPATADTIQAAIRKA